MNYVYPAIFYLEKNETYSVIFPDLNNLATQGDTLTEAMWMAEDALSLYLFTALRDGEPLPEASSIDKISKDEESAFINMILVNLTEYAKKYSDKSVKKTLSIPMWLNTLCEENNVNFSKILQEALINTVQKPIQR